MPVEDVEKPGFPAGVRGGAGSAVGRDGRGGHVAPDGRQYLCRARFQYRSVRGGGLILIKQIGQSRSRARYADCARQAVDVRVGSSRSRAPLVARVRPAADASATSSLPNVDEAVIYEF